MIKQIKNHLIKKNENTNTFIDNLQKFVKLTIDIILENQFNNYVINVNKEDINKIMGVAKNLKDIIKTLPKTEQILEIIEEYIKNIKKLLFI